MASTIRRAQPRTLLALTLATLGATASLEAASPERLLYVLYDANTIGTAIDGDVANAPAAQPIIGIAAGYTVRAIDVRPQNQRLYALAHDSVAGNVLVYHIDFGSGVPRATAVGAAASFVQADGTTPAPITGTAFGIDFNPSVDRIRVVTDAGQNFRLNPNTGGAVDGNGTATGTQMDGAINGGATTADDTAYTNNIVATVAMPPTTQYTLDAASNALYIQNPPNNGTLTAALPITVGGNPFDFTSASGLDIPPGIDVAASASPATGSAYAVLASTSSGANLYRINLATGAATQLGTFASAARDIAIATLVPSGIALSEDGTTLYRFALDRPQNAFSITVTGLNGGERLVGIDLRPATGQYFGIGIDDVANTGTVYRIDPQPGTASVATVIGTAGSLAFVDAGGAPVDLPAGSYGIDFNPTVDRIRVVAEGGRNFRARPDTGAPVDGNNVDAGTQTDSDINGSGVVGLNATAYASSFAGATFTTQFGLDATTNQLAIQNSPDSGMQTFPRAITLGGAPVDFDTIVGFDIPPGVTVPAPNARISGDGYAALTVNSVTSLYRIALGTGRATLLGPIGSGLTQTDGLVVSQSTPGPERGFVVLTDTGELQLAVESQFGIATTALPVQGVAAGEQLVAIDVRPQTNRLYGLGFNGVAGTVSLYHIDVNGTVALATSPGPAGSHTASDGVTPVLVAGPQFGMDFNPTVDRVRVVTSAGQNFRINPNTGALVDGDTSVSATGTQMDGALNDGATVADDTAYTNNIVNTDVTTQYTLDSGSNALYVQSPPNGGNLTLRRTIVDAATGGVIDFGVETGLDIPPRVNAAISNNPADGHAYAALRVGGASHLYRITLSSDLAATTAPATRIGTFQAGTVRDLAITTLVPSAFTLNAAGNSIDYFELARPDATLSTSVTGVSVGERLVGVDVRPVNGQVYALGIDDSANTGTLYRLSFVRPTAPMPPPPPTTAATAVGAPGSITFAGVDFGTGSWGFDFNPTVDRIRVVSDTGLNFRIHPDTGAPVSATPDGAINGAAVGVSATAYTNPYPFATPGSTFTTQYTLDPAGNQLLIQNQPNDGTQTVPVPVTQNAAPLDFAATAGFDIPAGVGNTTANAVAIGSGYAALTAGGATQIFSLDLATGAATSVGLLGNGLTAAEGLSVGTAPADVALSIAGAGGTEGTNLVVTVSRTGGSPLVVNYATESRTAIAGVDYTPRSDTLRFAANEFTKTITIPITSDALDEPAETFALVLTGPFTSGGTVVLSILPDALFNDGFE